VWTESIGTLAAILKTIAFAPQAIRTWRVGGEGLSWTMLALFGAGVGLWFVYGALHGSGPLLQTLTGCLDGRVERKDCIQPGHAKRVAHRACGAGKAHLSADLR